MEQLRDLLERNQVKIYFFSILIGIICGLTISSIISLETIMSFALALMLFATFLQVPISDIGQSFKNLNFILILFIVNFIILPIFTVILIQLLPAIPLIRFAVLFVLLCPCVDYVITFTHLVKGNAKVLLAMTPLILLIQMILVPIYLGTILGSEVSKLIEIKSFLTAFIYFIFIPLSLSALFQLFSKKSSIFVRVTSPLNLLPVPATAFVLFIVLASVTPQVGLAQQAAFQALPIFIIFAIVSPIIACIVTRFFKLDSNSARAISFSASYRNSLIILPLALAIPGSIPVVPAVILTQTIVELCFLPIYVKVIPKLLPTKDFDCE